MEKSNVTSFPKEKISKENTITGWKDGQKDYLRSQSSNIWYPADYSPMH